MRATILITILVLTGFQVKAKVDSTGDGLGFNTENLLYGGSLGLGISNIGFNIEVSPTVGYAFTKDLSAGPGVIYKYISFFDLDFKYQEIGGLLFLRYVLFDDVLFAQVNLEIVNQNRIYDGVRNNLINTALLVGLGYGGQRGFYYLVMYDVLQNPSLYDTFPWKFRVGLFF